MTATTRLVEHQASHKELLKVQPITICKAQLNMQETYPNRIGIKNTTTQVTSNSRQHVDYKYTKPTIKSFEYR